MNITSFTRASLIAYYIIWDKDLPVSITHGQMHTFKELSDFFNANKIRSYVVTTNKSSLKPGHSEPEKH